MKRDLGEEELITIFLTLASVIGLYRSLLWLGGVVVGRWTCDQQVASSIPGRRAFGCILGQVVHTHVPLSPSSIIWYQRKLGR